METSVVLKEHEYILESDKTSNNPTVYYIMPKTVRGATLSAVAYNKAFKAKKRTADKEIDAKALDTADVGEWITHVKKIKNYGINPLAPGATDGQSAYTHFELKCKEEPSVYVKNEDSGLIVIVETEDEKDLRNIYFSMSTTSVEEIMDAVVNFSKLTDTEKN